MKHCAMQLAIDGVMIEDTDIISLAEAEALWDKYIPVFKDAVVFRKDAEMALWINMKTPTNYREKAKHWRSSDMVIERGVMYEKRRVA